MIVCVTTKTISNWMKVYKIKSRVMQCKPSKKKLCEMYFDKNMTQIKIAEVFCVSYGAIQYWMKKYGIETRICSKSFVDSKKIPKENLEEMYYNKMMSQTDIAYEIGVTQETILNWMKGYGIESRTIPESMSRENNPNWKKGVSFEPYCYKFNITFKEAVRERDDYACQLCGIKQNGERLSVHHIHYDKKNCYPDVVALCRSCHNKTMVNRNYWENYFENQLIERGLYCWSLSHDT